MLYRSCYGEEWEARSLPQPCQRAYQSPNAHHCSLLFRYKSQFSRYPLPLTPFMFLSLAAWLLLLSARGAFALSAPGPASLQAPDPLPNSTWVENLDLSNMTAYAGEPRAGKSFDGHPLKLNNVVYPHGIGTRANSQMTIDLKGAALQFAAMVGMDDEVNKNGIVQFIILVDGKTAADSGVLKGGDPPRLLSVDLAGAHTMVMAVKGIENPAQWDSLSQCHADWAGAMLILTPGAAAPQSVDFSLIPSAFQFPVILPEDSCPAIHGPRITGASPHRPFLFRISATGKGPLTYSASPLPPGLRFDPGTGILSGQVEASGTYHLQLGAAGPGGKGSRSLTLVCGEGKLALTPPMGWNAWNVYGETVTAGRVRQQADLLIRSGLAAHGFQYVVVDDTWQARRDPDGTIGPNHRFGNLKALAAYLHSKGLKFGLYSSPTDETCSGYAGSSGHEQQDAASYAAWGVDYVKYDWCSARSTKKDVTDEVLKAAFGKMGQALEHTGRDILYTINTYGFGKAWEWGKDMGIQSWWTSPEILDQWNSIQSNGFGQADLMAYAGPGHWNDPGWLMMGRLGFSTPRFTHLRLSEQMTQVSLWSLMSAPLILSCDLAQLDPNPFCPITTALLTNDEVLDIDQDSLGEPARRVAGVGDIEVWARPLADGTRAVGLFNKKVWTQEIQVQWSDLGISGSQPVRNLWQHKDLGQYSGSFSSFVPAHGVVLLKVGQPQRQEG